MLTAVVLMMCMVVCVRGDVISDNTNRNTTEEDSKDTNAVLDQVLEELTYLRDVNKKNMDEINILKDADKKKTDEINNLKFQATAGGAAFMAVIDGGSMYINAGTVVPFVTVLLNVGRHYDDGSFVFTCAERGLYMFSVTLYAGGIRQGSEDRAVGALILDGVNVAESRGIATDPDHFMFPQSSVTAVVECPKGGRVWVECQEDESLFYGYDDSPRSIFTGYAITYLIHP